jgi:UDP-glucose 4-epimerase
MMRILITGGAGFIGTALAHYLLALEGEVMIVDNLSTGDFDNIDPRSEFRVMDILDDGFLEVSVKFAPDVIVHLAAIPSVPLCEADPSHAQAVNIQGTRRVIEAAKASGVERLVFASSSAVYGNPQELPLVETMPCAPENIYGETKLLGEQLIRKELDPTDIDYALLRFSNVYGPRQNTEGEGGVVASFCEALVNDRLPVIFGDGQQTRDFIYVADIVQAISWTIGGDIAFRECGDVASDDTTDDRGAFNISTGEATPVEALLNTLRMPSGFTRGAVFEPARTGDIEHSVLSPRKALEVFEWESAIGLADGLEATWLWYSRPR